MTPAGLQRIKRARQTRIGIVLLLLHGMEIKRVGDLLGISKRGVYYHLARIKKAMGGTIYDVARTVASVEQSKWAL